MGLMKTIKGILGIPDWTSGTVKSLVVDDDGLLYKKDEPASITVPGADSTLRSDGTEIIGSTLLKNYGTYLSINKIGTPSKLISISDSGLAITEVMNISTDAFGIIVETRGTGASAYSAISVLASSTWNGKLLQLRKGTDSPFVVEGSGEVKFGSSGTSYYNSFISPSGMTASVDYVLPDEDGTAGQVLSTDGSGNLSWVDN